MTSECLCAYYISRDIAVVMYVINCFQCKKHRLDCSRLEDDTKNILPALSCLIFETPISSVARCQENYVKSLSFLNNNVISIFPYSKRVLSNLDNHHYCS